MLEVVSIVLLYADRINLQKLIFLLSFFKLVILAVLNIYRICVYLFKINAMIPEINGIFMLFNHIEKWIKVRLEESNFD